ncbi:MAG: hypothetical protein MRT15_11685, partial [archaeon YNP-LCB-003-016]|uniref:hypothetical protein n=1 Tax=Candidatus Culexarchaeum yellowstonense TaxID=2928963 RepID=UPI0026EAEF0E
KMGEEAKSLLELKVRREDYDVIIEDEGFFLRLHPVPVFGADGSITFQINVSNWSEACEYFHSKFHASMGLGINEFRVDNPSRRESLIVKCESLVEIIQVSGCYVKAYKPYVQVYFERPYGEVSERLNVEEGKGKVVRAEGFQIRDYGPKLDEVGVFIRLSDGSEVLIPEKMMREIVKSWSEV